MSTSYRPIASISSQTFPQPVTALAFDPVSDIIWTGSNTGSVTAYYGTRGARGVSFPVGGTLGVVKIVAGENYVRAVGVGDTGLGSWAKGGRNKWYHRASTAITTFSDTSGSTHLLAASTAGQELLFLNALTGSVIRQAPTPSVVTQLQFSHSVLLSGSSDGFLRTHDPRTGLGRAESHVRAHSSGVQCIQTSGNFVFTIGLGERQSRPFPDPLVKIYDLRTMRPLPPIPFSSGPAFIQVLPRRPSTIAIISNQGLINIVDASNPATGEFYQLDLASYLTSVSISPTAAYMAFGDAEGMIHLMTQAEDGSDLPLNGFEGQPIDWPDTPAPLPEIQWAPETPLNSIGLPYYDRPLLSAWTPQFLSTNSLHSLPAKIPSQILASVKKNDNIAYAPLPRELKGRRNMIVVGPRTNGRFRSGKSRPDHDPEPTTFGSAAEDVPGPYRRVEIEYSKFGIEDFDFGYYNKTRYSGLETHILNSYTNSLLQALHYTIPVRKLAKSHIASDCPREHCFLCELGFVVRMLEDAEGTNCQASNFCKTVGVLAQVSNAIELIDYGRDSPDADYGHKIQSFHRFLIDHLVSEGNTFPQNPLLLPSTLQNASSLAAAPMTQLLGVDGKNIITCLNCGAIREKEHMTHIIDLTYPRKALHEPRSPVEFTNILRSSLLRHMTHKATCQTCKQFSSFSSRRLIPSRDLPPILAVNARADNEDLLAHWIDWRGRTFLKAKVELQGEIDCVDDPETAVYDLRAMVVQIVSKNKHCHHVAIVKVPETERKHDESSPWFLFNDFSVTNIEENEALSFPGTWKIPAILYYERTNVCDELDFSGLPEHLDTSILNRDTSISLNRDPSLIKHECLQSDELPTPGTLVAIDAEFVSMQQEETDFRSDGSNKVLRPARMSLARVSVLRGFGPKEGVPFIDDHIHTSEAIVDYLTEFSGIKFGDLDPHLSRHTLTPLKLVYKKLRLLVDRGCIFIGHGLSKDFRIINLFVPPDQVIDTVDLYFLRARQRRLSLRFLSWFVLHENIQTDTHDSIEDARSALRLYVAYQNFEKDGIFDKKLEELYKEGKQYNFKPPAPSPTVPSQVVDAKDTTTLPFPMMPNSSNITLAQIFPDGNAQNHNSSNLYQANLSWRR
ncbi:ubiquitin carboxyl-terminal hydrolase-domain-containing protein [Infundibulicybe gibba]|nr:ubiquitin carboxyl-terminal hydrolase-domain-containing protein [Infundibulicybe gibba]